MKYKFLKKITGVIRSWDVGETISLDLATSLLLSDGIEIPVSELIEQQFIEEVKETTKPKWKVGDYAVRIWECGDCSIRTRYVKIQKIEEICPGTFWYDGHDEKSYRNPTKEELSLYFK